MTLGWSMFVNALVAINIAGCVWLLWWTSRPHPGDRDANSTGHVWDGDLTEFDKPLPKWWINLFYITIVFAIGYLIWFPGFGAFTGVGKWSSPGELARDQAVGNEKLAAAFRPYDGKAIDELARDPHAVELGRAAGLRNVYVGNVPGGGSVTISGRDFIMGHNDDSRLASADGDHEKFTSLGGLSIDVTNTARLGDLTARGALHVQAGTIEFLGRGPGLVRLDRTSPDPAKTLDKDTDLDFVGGSVNIAGAPDYKNSAMPTAAAGSPGGSFLGSPVLQLTSPLSLQHTDTVYHAPDGTVNWILDLAAAGVPVQSNLATALASALPGQSARSEERRVGKECTG
jgi:hypothetical protein